jgi:hypothetical protein
MKHCVRHISAAINRLASRNIFLKATKMVNLARHTQQNFSSSSPLPGGPTTCSVKSVYAGVYFFFSTELFYNGLFVWKRDTTIIGNPNKKVYHVSLYIMEIGSFTKIPWKRDTTSRDTTTTRIRITNNEPRCCPNLSFILRFGKRLIHVCNNNNINFSYLAT